MGRISRNRMSSGIYHVFNRGINGKRAMVLVLLAVAGFAQCGEISGRGVKIWPQITDGIRNHAGTQTMNCVIAADGLTVTDKAWESYRPSGLAKRWNFNMGPFIEAPLTNYRFPDEFAGLPLTITVELYNPQNIWDVRENYQEIIRLGGEPRIGLPAWFRFPVNRLGYDFDEGNWFPSGWKLPAGKYALWQGAAKARQKDRRGKPPVFDFGFTHISPVALTPGGKDVPRKNRAHLFGDGEWIVEHHTGGADPKNWRIEPFLRHAEENAIIIPDFEAPDSWTWQDHQFREFAGMIARVRKHRPDLLIGCWGVGVSPGSFRIFDHNGTGSVNLEGAAQWRDRYRNPESNVHPVLERCGLNFGNPAVYWVNNTKPSQLYAFLQEWEEGKIARPGIPNVFSTWIQVEFVDGYPMSEYRFADAAGKVQFEKLKHQVPASAQYALSLFGHCVMDGLQCWEIGSRYSEKLEDYRDVKINETAMARVTVNGQPDVAVYYYLKYFGFYNFHVLGMWQASVNKDIIEAATPWIMPELWSSGNKAWRTGDERYPSYANFYREPLSRVKLSADGRTLLVIAANPWNTGVQQVKVRLPGRGEEFAFELVADFPVIRRFPLRSDAP